jgi:hypothetical protein
MYQSEAMWIRFGAQAEFPKALKVAVGKVNAINGNTWTQHINVNDTQNQDYVVIPAQAWLDGINSGVGSVKQFVAMPLGSGTTVEAQVTGKEEFGGIQMMVFESKEEKRLAKFPPKVVTNPWTSTPVPRSIFDVPAPTTHAPTFNFGMPTTQAPQPSLSFGPALGFGGAQQPQPTGFGSSQTTCFGSTQAQPTTVFSLGSTNQPTTTFGFGAPSQTGGFSFGSQPSFNKPVEMGISAGGSIKQAIVKDPYGPTFWDQGKFGRVYVHIVNSEMYQQITGRAAPTTPITRQTYINKAMPWYDIYDEKPGVLPSDVLSNIKSPYSFEQYQPPMSVNNVINISSPHQQVTNAPIFGKTKHEGVWCDNCKTTPLIGARYKCMNCVDYDLCENCESKSEHIHNSDHVFCKLKKPITKQLTNSILHYNMYSPFSFT